MRARAGLAARLWRRGEREAAVEHYHELLRLNPNDNQGIRYLLAAWLLELGRDDDLAALLKRYEGDAMAACVYAKALLAFRRAGDSSVADVAIAGACARRARNTNQQQRPTSDPNQLAPH
jgi:hypothetical protein